MLTRDTFIFNNKVSNKQYMSKFNHVYLSNKLGNCAELEHLEGFVKRTGALADVHYQACLTTASEEILKQPC